MTSNTLAVATELKQLHTRLTKEQALQKSLNEEKQSVEGKMRDCSAEIKNLQKKIGVLEKTNPEPIVTEHAVLRYLERVKGVDLKAIHAEILSPDLVQQIKVIGSGSFPREGYRLVVKRGTVITVEV